MCGSGAVQGGAISGIGGHNATMTVLEATSTATAKPWFAEYLGGALSFIMRLD
jgi:hypothetical protein